MQCSIFMLSFSSMFGALKQECSLVMSASTDFHIKQRSVKEFLTLEGCTPIEIHRHVKSVYWDGCMDVKNVRKWVQRAKSCCAGEMSGFETTEKFVPDGSRDNWLTPWRNTGKLLLKNFLTNIVLKGMISSRILPLETNTGFIIRTWKTKGNPWNITIQVLRV